jgi:hypothetical protein
MGKLYYKIGQLNKGCGLSKSNFLEKTLKIVPVSYSNRTHMVNF